jgi:transcriptional regulator with XRE-family HTH domain
MVNIEDFIKRLEIILDYYSLNASSFADKIGVQRSSMSHLLSGRNKPSLDFILKILEVYPEVDLYWILNGKGSFPKKEDRTETKNNAPTPITNLERIASEIEKEDNLFGVKNPISKNRIVVNTSTNFSNEDLSSDQENETAIDRIVIFYKNGTFRNYSPN